MDRRAKAALIFLTITFAVGAAITALNQFRIRTAAARQPVAVIDPVDTTDLGARLIDLNRCRQYELEALPGIGPKLASRIIDYRERHGGFRSVAELRSVPGIGPKRHEAIRHIVTVGQAGPDSLR